MSAVDGSSVIRAAAALFLAVSFGGATAGAAGATPEPGRHEAPG